MLLKFNNIRDLDDARYAAAMMAEWIGFRVGYDDSLPVGKIQEILGWCAGPKLILELHENVDVDTVQSFLDVLPANGLECSAAVAFLLLDEVNDPGLEWIVTGAQNMADPNRFYLHDDTFHPGERQIKRLLNPLEELEFVKQELPYAISLDCFEGTPGEPKDYQRWNDFFDALDLP